MLFRSGGYLRLLPYCYTAAGLRRINNEEHEASCIYFHPWELDPDQPRIARGAISRLRTYTGLKGMKRKIERLLMDFRFAPLTEVHPVHQMGGVDPKALCGTRLADFSVRP